MSSVIAAPELITCGGNGGTGFPQSSPGTGGTGGLLLGLNGLA
jgi:hypothetical protein